MKVSRRGFTRVEDNGLLLGYVPRGFEGRLTYGTRKENLIDRSIGTREQTKWSPKPPHPFHRRGWRKEGEGNDVLLPILPLLPRLCPLCGMWTQTPAMPPNDGRLPADVLAPCTPCASSSLACLGRSGGVDDGTCGGGSAAHGATRDARMRAPRFTCDPLASVPCALSLK